MTFSYIDRLQADKFSFIRIPKALLTENTFAALSSQAKILYGIMVDKMDDSMRNKWQDDAGRVYIVYPVSEIQADLQLSRRKVIDCLAELEQIGLIERRKRGRGLPSILYVKNFAMSEG